LPPRPKHKRHRIRKSLVPILHYHPKILRKATSPSPTPKVGDVYGPYVDLASANAEADSLLPNTVTSVFAGADLKFYLFVVDVKTGIPPPPPPPSLVPFDSSWFYQGNAGSAVESNGTLQIRMDASGGSDNDYLYQTAQMGEFPWGGSGTSLPVGITNIQSLVNILSTQFGTGHSHCNIYIGLYYTCPSAFDGWLDTQVRIEVVDGNWKPDGSTSTYGGPGDPGVQADGFSIAQLSNIFNIDVAAQAQMALAAWGLNDTAVLAGVEMGVEAFNAPDIQVDFQGYLFTSGQLPPPPPPPSAVSWHPAITETPRLVTVAQLLANPSTFTIPNKRMLPSTTVNPIQAGPGTGVGPVPDGFLFQIDNVTVQAVNVAGDGEAFTFNGVNYDDTEIDFIDPSLPAGQLQGIHGEADMNWKLNGLTSMTDYPAAGDVISVQGYAYFDPDHTSTNLGAGRELHALTAWKDSSGGIHMIGTGVVTPPPPPPPPPIPGAVQQVIIVPLENTGLDTMYAQAFTKQLADTYALSQNWNGIGHPSEPNYIAIAFGDTFGVNSDGDSTTHPPPSILDLVRASGRSFKVIQNGSRGFDHNGFLLESPDISNTTAGDVPDVMAAVNSGIDFVWFTPDDSQNGHDTGAQFASQWLSTWIPGLLQAISGKKALLIVTTDEDGPQVYTAFAGPAAKQGYKSSNRYDHYSFGKLIESIWGGSGLRNCDSAPAPTEFFLATTSTGGSAKGPVGKSNRKP